MPAARKVPVTAATRHLKAAGANYSDHLYAYEDRGGTAVSARELGVEESSVVKTLIFEDDQRQPLVVLMPGHLEVSSRALARLIGARSTQPCSPEIAEKHTGYKVGGTSPFGLKKALPIYAEAGIRQLDRIYINGGARGYLIGMCPSQLQELLHPQWVEVSQAQ